MLNFVIRHLFSFSSGWIGYSQIIIPDMLYHRVFKDLKMKKKKKKKLILQIILQNQSGYSHIEKCVMIFVSKSGSGNSFYFFIIFILN